MQNGWGCSYVALIACMYSRRSQLDSIPKIWGDQSANSFPGWAMAGRSQWQGGYFDGEHQGKTGNGDLERRGGAKYRPCLVSQKFYKIFQILHHIEYLDVCIKY